MTPTEIALAAVTAIFVDFDAAATEALLAPDYIQHNAGVPTGAAPVIGMVPALKDMNIGITTHRVIAEGDMVVMHNTYTNAQAFGGPTMVAFDVFRIEDGKVAEHWDNLQPIAEVNASGRTMTDGPTEITDKDKSAANKALIEGLMADIMIGGKMEKVTDYISPVTYLQHNPGVGDGLEALGGAMQAMAEAGSAMRYDKVHMVVADGNFVFTASEGAMGDTPTAFFDLFRVEDGLVVEHWDVIADIPTESANDNGKF